EAINTQTLFMNDEDNLNKLQQSIDHITQCLANQGTIFACGNGGSHADANHFIAELTGRYEAERRPLAGLVLGANPSHMSAVANDYGYDQVFARELEALGKSGDILVAISTSGNSQNVIKAVEVAKALGMKTIGWLGGNGGALKDLVDIAIVVQAGPLLVSGKSTFQIQNIHHVLIHATCKSVELALLQ
ncbi:MAG: SIS domain-containing protein, partial [Candidatus Absconditabacterales bacterium]